MSLCIVSAWFTLFLHYYVLLVHNLVKCVCCYGTISVSCRLVANINLCIYLQVFSKLFSGLNFENNNFCSILLGANILHSIILIFNQFFKISQTSSLVCWEYEWFNWPKRCWSFCVCLGLRTCKSSWHCSFAKFDIVSTFIRRYPRKFYQSCFIPNLLSV